MQLVDETRIRETHELLIHDSPSIGNHFFFINDVLDCLDRYVRITAHADEHDLVYLRLLVRCFNSLAASLSLSLAGFWQPSILVIRDLAETASLLELFQYDKAQLVKWIGLESKDRWSQFKPGAVRQMLSKIEGHDLGKRNQVYGRLSSLGGHPTPEGLQIMEIDSLTQVGPFADEARFRAMLEEMARQCDVLVRTLRMAASRQVNPSERLSIVNELAACSVKWFENLKRN
jgi:hypothetical protein